MEYQTVVSDGLQSISNFFRSVYGFIFDGGISQWMADVLAYVFEWYIYIKLYIIKLSIQASIVVVEDLFNTLNLGGQVDGYWQAIDPSLRGLMVFFHLPLIVSMFISAYVVKFMFRFTGIR
ncbi:MAG: hypothetical protein HQL75_05875 [Magnetococcales bacterium]|nr:hypothetical protein [Magnetococcales bacterium]